MKRVESQWPASRVENWQIQKIKPYTNNPRTHPPEQISLLAKAMQDDGVTMPILIDDDGVIIAGHGRLLAAQQNKFAVYPVVIARGWSEQKKKAARLRDNQLGVLSGWDSELLALEVGSLRMEGFDLPLLGFDSAQLDDLLIFGREDDPADEIPEPPKKAVTKPGDIWLLGRHRVMCGDCRDPDSVDKLLNGQKVNVAFTSPPYAEQREYDPASGFKPIPPDEYVDWFEDVAQNVGAHLAKDGSWFVNIKPGISADGLDTDLYVLDLVAAHRRQWGWHFVTEFCWERNGVPKAVARRFKNQFEPIYQFAKGLWKMNAESVRHESLNVPIPGGPGSGNTNWAPAQGNRGPMFGAEKKRRKVLMVDQDLADIQGKQRRRGLGVGPTNASRLQGISGAYAADIKKKRKKGHPSAEGNQGTSWQSEQGPLGVNPKDIGPGMAYPGNRLPTFGQSHEALGHAAAFPVGLPEFFIRAFSFMDDAIYDPFLGSGSTVIAAHRTNRIGYGMEISPIYVDISVERWQRLTGEKAYLLQTKKGRRREIPLAAKVRSPVT